MRSSFLLQFYLDSAAVERPWQVLSLRCTRTGTDDPCYPLNSLYFPPLSKEGQCRLASAHGSGTTR